MARGRPVAVRTSGTSLAGADELRKALATLEAAARQQILEEAVAAGGEAIRASAADRVKDDPQLAAAVAVKVTTTRAGRTVALIGIDKTVQKGFLVSRAYWREFGTRAHAIAAGALVKLRGRRGRPARTKSDKKVLASPQQVYGTRVQHPGFSARPFLRPAMDVDGPRALAAMAQTIRARIAALIGR